MVEDYLRGRLTASTGGKQRLAKPIIGMTAMKPDKFSAMPVNVALQTSVEIAAPISSGALTCSGERIISGISAVLFSFITGL